MAAKVGELFGKRVRAARKAAKLTLQKTADKLDMSLNHLAQIERGTRQPSFDLIFKLAEIYDVPALSFFNFDAAETDAKLLRRKVEAKLGNYTAEQLSQVYRFMQFIVGP